MKEKTVKVPDPRQLPSGAWRIQLRMKNEAGQTVSVSVTKDTQKECVAEAIKYKMGKIPLPVKEGDSGKISEAASNKNVLTLTKAIDHYIALHEAALSPVSIRTYRTYQKHRLQGIMNLPVKEINAEVLQLAVNEDLKKNSSKTMKSTVGFISSVLAHEGGLKLEKGQVVVGQVIVKDKAFLQPNEIKPFLKAMEGSIYELPALLALHGLRASEILNLTWGSIKDGMIHVEGAAVPDEVNILTHKETNKNASSRRMVPVLIDRLQKVFDEGRAKFAADSAMNEKEIDKSYIFNYHSSGGIYNGINLICRKANLPEVGIHGLRHSFASLCYHKGLSEKATMKLGGWSDYATMRKIYTHLSSQDLDEGIENLRASFN